MKRLIFLALTFVSFAAHSQSVGISTNVNFSPTNTLDVDGRARIRGKVIIDSLAPSSGTRWLTIAANGVVDTTSTGGPVGPQGPTGPQGLTGATGPSGTAGQSVTSVFGTSSLTVLNTTNTFTLIPGLTTTLTIPSSSFVMIYTDGTFITNSTSGTGYSTLDFAIFINGAYPANGGYCRLTADNPGSLSTTTNNGFQWTLSSFQALSAGSHTIEVRVVYVAGVSATVSSSNTSVRQGSLHVVIIKQ